MCSNMSLVSSIVILKFVLAGILILVFVNKGLVRICSWIDKFCRDFSILEISFTCNKWCIYLYTILLVFVNISHV